MLNYVGEVYNLFQSIFRTFRKKYLDSFIISNLNVYIRCTKIRLKDGYDYLR